MAAQVAREHPLAEFDRQDEIEQARFRSRLPGNVVQVIEQKPFEIFTA